MKDIRTIITNARNHLSKEMVERDDEIDICLACAVAGEHVLLVGDPGTGKSMLAKAIQSGIGGKQFFVLLNKFTTPEEVFGPINVPSLKEGKYERIPSYKLPEASVAVLDEIFKASSAILNTTLTILNERKWINGTTEVDVPLEFCMGCSNEWPAEQQELGALFDRFMVRKEVHPVSSESGIMELMTRDSFDTSFPEPLPPGGLNKARQEAAEVQLDTESLGTIYTIIRECRREGIRVGDRRIRKSIALIKAMAYINGNDSVTNDDLEILTHIYWSDPSQIEKANQIISRIAAPSSMQVNSLLIEAKEIDNSIKGSDLATMATAGKKLGEVLKKLKAIKTPKAEKARQHVEGMITALKMATIKSFA